MATPNPGAAPEDKPRAQHEAEVLAAPDTLEKILDHLTSGGGMIDLCQMWDIRYPAVMKWLRSGPKNDDGKTDAELAYAQAIKDRDEWVRETLLHEVRRIADFGTVHEDNGRLKLKLEAIKMLGGEAGLFLNKVEQVRDPAPFRVVLTDERGVNAAAPLLPKPGDNGEHK